MGLQKVALNFMVERGGKITKSLLCAAKPRKMPINFNELRYVPQPERGIVQLSAKELEQLNKKADELIKKLRRDMDADYIEKFCPETIENVKKGHITCQNEMNYLHYLTLENFRKENPALFVFFGEKGSANDLRIMMTKLGDSPIQIAKHTSIDEIKLIFSEIDDFCKKHSFKPTFLQYMSMFIMKKNNPRTYQFFMKSKNPEIISKIKYWGKDYYYGELPSARFFKNVTPEQIQVMINDKLPFSMHARAYVECSDEFVRDKKAVKEFSEELSKCKLSSDVMLYRGDKTVGMFDEIAIDRNMEIQIRQLLEQNKEYAKNMRVTTYSGIYLDAPSTNLYDFLSSKETLTLADAMQVAKFGDDSFISSLIQKIKDSKIVDKRFKSFSLDEGMADKWRTIHSGNNTTIVQRTIISQGTQGGFYNGSNSQFEVILNNTPKEVSFENVAYNKGTDTFELNTLIQNV